MRLSDLEMTLWREISLCRSLGECSKEESRGLRSGEGLNPESISSELVDSVNVK